MEFRIADTFTGSLARLSTDEQKAVKTTAFDLQMNPANPGLQFHRLDRAKDQRFWSVRVNGDLRLIVHRTDSSLLLCYVNHHDKAYEWGEKRRLEAHPRTGAAQLVEIRETVREVVVQRIVEETRAASVKPKLFADFSESDLLKYGVPPEWMQDVQEATEDTILEVADHLPVEAAEALVELATGGKPSTAPVTPNGDPFEHPDAQRRFRTVQTPAELERALGFPWEKWIVFLHPAQRQMVERDYSGPARVAGSAGTGKTIVALHRAVFLARSRPESRVLLTTFSATLANALRGKLRCLVLNEPRLADRLEVHAIDAIGRRLYEVRFGKVSLATAGLIGDLLRQAAANTGVGGFSLPFLRMEWEQVVDAWQVADWETYRKVPRLGRRTRLPEIQRAALWEVFANVRTLLRKSGFVTQAEMYSRVAEELGKESNRPFQFAVVDEAQDVNVAQLRFLAALAGGQPNGLFFAGDLGQRIFQQPFSWKGLGVDVRGRSFTLRINYRTSHQIRMSADRLLGPEVTDVDGISDSRKGTVSTFNGPAPQIRVGKSEAEETELVAAWLRDRIADGLTPAEFGVFVRTEAQVGRAAAALERVGVPFRVLDELVETSSGKASVGTMHLAKGLEFRAVVVMACDDEVIPLQERIEGVSEDSDLEEVYNTERHLLYVACTRARDFLLVSGREPASEFLDDLARTARD